MSAGQCLAIMSLISRPFLPGIVHWILILFFSGIVERTYCLQLTHLDVPTVADLREEMEINCHFDMGVEDLYAVKWYKDDQEFFSYVPSRQSHTRTFPVPGVHLVPYSTNCSQVHCKVRLKDLTRDHSGGAYRCEISSEAPAFRIVAQTHNVTVAALPRENPRIEGVSTSYSEGDTVEAKCISDPADPTPILSWYINGQEPEMIEVNGYKCQIHYVITEDGYNLTMHRVVHSNGTSNNGRPAFLQHGIMTDATNWVTLGNSSLAFFLFNQGYDVWMGNARGNRYSRNHITLKDSNPKFWDFSVDNLALLDLPKVLHTVVNKTGQKVIYIGHSLGGTTLMMYASERPEEANNLICLTLLLAPVVYPNLELQLKFIFDYGYYLTRLFLDLRITSLFRKSTLIARIFQNVCSFLPYACRIGADLTFGKTNQLLNEDLLLLYSYNSMTISVRFFRQLALLSRKKILQKYDFGEKQNLKLYGQKWAPIYNFTNVVLSEVHLYYTNQDAFVRFQGIRQLFKEISSPLKYMMLLPIDGKDVHYSFNHMDFVYSRHLHELLYADFQKILEKYPSQKIKL